MTCHFTNPGDGGERGIGVWRGSERDDQLYYGLRGCVSQTNNIMI